VLCPLSGFELCAVVVGIGGDCCCEAKEDKVVGERTAVAMSKDAGFCRKPVNERANILASATNHRKDAIGEMDRDGSCIARSFLVVTSGGFGVVSF
jgi:hypothetical protein